MFTRRLRLYRLCCSTMVLFYGKFPKLLIDWIVLIFYKPKTTEVEHNDEQFFLGGAKAS